tara:strand:- start:629 stop:1135 length:507 start_codon:yes stop_codon:yes gene_type:complete
MIQNQLALVALLPTVVKYVHSGFLITNISREGFEAFIKDRVVVGKRWPPYLRSEGFKVVSEYEEWLDFKGQQPNADQEWLRSVSVNEWDGEYTDLIKSGASSQALELVPEYLRGGGPSVLQPRVIILHYWLADDDNISIITFGLPTDHMIAREYLFFEIGLDMEEKGL